MTRISLAFTFTHKDIILNHCRFTINSYDSYRYVSDFNFQNQVQHNNYIFVLSYFRNTIFGNGFGNIFCVEIWGNAANIYLDPLIKLQKKIIRVITFSQYLAHTNDLFVQLQILPFKKLVIHRIGLQMFKNNLGYIPKAVESLFITNSDIHKYNTRNKDKMRSAYGKHEFMYSNFRFVGIHIWNYILDHLDVNVTLPKFKKTFKTHILADNFTYIV